MSKLRIEASTYIKEADLEEAYSYNEAEDHFENHRLLAIYDKFVTETRHLMAKVLEQIGTDVGKLRSRIELDKVS